MISAPSFELSNDIGNDRFVKAKFQFTTKAYLINEDARNRPTIQKLIPANKVVVNFTEISPSIQKVKLQDTTRTIITAETDATDIVNYFIYEVQTENGTYESFDKNVSFIASLIDTGIN
jgi:hypothetical protein